MKKKIVCFLMVALVTVAACFAEAKVYESAELGGWIILEQTDNVKLTAKSPIIAVSNEVSTEYTKNFLGVQAFQMLTTYGHIETITYNELDGYKYMEWIYRYTDKTFYSRELVLDWVLNAIRRK